MISTVGIARAPSAGARFKALLRSVAPSAVMLSLAFSCVHTQRAEALPAFARQTGQTCSTCHTAFLQLTPFGRRFKLNGYISRGGGPDGASGTRDALIDPPLPLAFMWQSTFTHLNRGYDAPAGTLYSVPSPNGGYPNENNFADAAQQMSIYYGGQIYGNLGAFVQFSYSNTVGRNFQMDNSDVRYTDQFTIGDVDVLWGITANNRPTMQDVWNTTPVWAYPFLTSGFAPGPQAATMIESWQPLEAWGAGGYVFVNNTFYAELSAYGSPSPTLQTTMGESPVQNQLGYTISGLAPYWRLAAEPVWGEHALMVGTYGMTADILPNRIYGFGTDKVTDIGFDSQYQWLTDLHAVTFRANYIWEKQILDASSNPNLTGGPLAANPVDYLRSMQLSAEYVYNHMYAFEVQYFQITGSPDAITYQNNFTTSPNSAGWVFDVSYLPFMRGGPKFWPWLNTRIGASYTLYTRFDGSTNNVDGSLSNPLRKASDNNTLMLYSWTMW
jgi:hypothetical protein